MAELAPRPWRKWTEYAVVDKNGQQLFMMFEPELRDLIINRVNAHKGLVAACEEACELLERLGAFRLVRESLDTSQNRLVLKKIAAALEAAGKDAE